LGFPGNARKLSKIAPCIFAVGRGATFPDRPVDVPLLRPSGFNEILRAVESAVLCIQLRKSVRLGGIDHLMGRGEGAWIESGPQAAIFVAIRMPACSAASDVERFPGYAMRNDSSALQWSPVSIYRIAFPNRLRARTAL